MFAIPADIFVLTEKTTVAKLQKELANRGLRLKNLDDKESLGDDNVQFVWDSNGGPQIGFCESIDSGSESEIGVGTHVIVTPLN